LLVSSKYFESEAVRVRAVTKTKSQGRSGKDFEQCSLAASYLLLKDFDCADPLVNQDLHDTGEWL
jgi:hypothetical protein